MTVSTIPFGAGLAASGAEVVVVSPVPFAFALAVCPRVSTKHLLTAELTVLHGMMDWKWYKAICSICGWLPFLSALFNFGDL